MTEDSLQRLYEVDFIIQRGNDIIPVEVKAEVRFGGREIRSDIVRSFIAKVHR